VEPTKKHGRSAGRIPWPFCVIFFLIVITVGNPAALGDESALATLVIYNADFPESADLAAFYASRRDIPKNQIVALHCPVDEEIDRATYDQTIAQPLRDEFKNQNWWTVDESGFGPPMVTANKIRFIALIRGMPLKIRFQAIYEGNQPDPTKPYGVSNEKAVDSELAILGYFRRQISGPLNNPYYRSFGPISDSDPRLMLVGRLDAPTAADVRRMINASITAEQNGLQGWTYLDARGTNDPGYRLGDDWLKNIKKQSFQRGRPAIIDLNEALFPQGYPMTDAMLYFGWYADKPSGLFQDSRFRFRPGAIAVHIYSFSASTIRQPPESWVSSLINHGAAATLGNVYEPFLELTPALDVFHDRLLSGMTFAESAYSSMVAVSWMTAVVGDPLYRPFRPNENSAQGHSSWEELQTILEREKDQVLFADLNKRGVRYPLFFEVAALLAEDEEKYSAALDAFDQAYSNYHGAAEKFRCILDKAELLRRLGRFDDLAKLIHRAANQFTESSQRAILEGYLLR
jgi:uncharacterized protein (TIGR03790 family)